MSTRRASGLPTRKREGLTNKIEGPRDTPFVLSYPPGWRKIPKRELQTQAEPPVAGVRRADGRGLVVLTLRGKLAYPLPKMLEDFRGVLEEKYAAHAFELSASQLVQTPAGVGMYSSWVLRDEERVYGHMTVGVGEHSYTLDGTLPVGAADVAREVGAILGNFDVAS